MAERDYANDWDDWMRNTGGDTGYGGTIPTNDDPYQPIPQPDPNAWLYDPNANPSGFPQLPGGRTWVWNGNQWTAASAPAAAAPTGPTYDNYETSYGGNDGGDYSYKPPSRTPLRDLNYPDFNAPRFQAPAEFKYDPFSYEEFKAPTLEEAQNEPGFDYALKQGVKAFENSKAYTGTYRGGATVKGINDYARNMANQNYGQVFERKGQTYDRNRGNAFGNWNANRTNAADAYSMNYGVSRDVFDRNYSAAKDEYAPRARAAELDFARDFDVFSYEGDDAYRRWKALVDANS